MGCPVMGQGGRGMAEIPCSDLMFCVPYWSGFRSCVVHFRVWGVRHHIGVGSCPGGQFVSAVGEDLLGFLKETLSQVWVVIRQLDGQSLVVLNKCLPQCV